MSVAAEQAGPPARPAGTAQERVGLVLVALSALAWSFGGAIALYVSVADTWAVVFWRALWAASFIFAFMLWRDGARGTLGLLAGMGLPGLGVALCFATAGTSFVVALAYTTVANIVLMQAGVPLLAALIAWLLFGERVALSTGVAIAAVIGGVAVMVSDSLSGRGSLVGDGLALLIALVFSTATVLTRRFAQVRMTPATGLGMVLATLFAFAQAGSLRVSAAEMGVLFAFGALNLGLGLALFASGARLVPAAIAALLGTLETVLAPVWVWLFHGQVPAGRTLLGGTIVFAALVAHLALEVRRGRGPASKPGTAGIPSPQ